MPATAHMVGVRGARSNKGASTVNPSARPPKTTTKSPTRIALQGIDSRITSKTPMNANIMTQSVDVCA